MQINPKTELDHNVRLDNLEQTLTRCQVQVEQVAEQVADVRSLLEVFVNKISKKLDNLEHLLTQGRTTRH